MFDKLPFSAHHASNFFFLRQVPFIVYNVPELDRAVEEWSDPARLTAALGDRLYRFGMAFRLFGMDKERLFVTLS